MKRILCLLVLAVFVLGAQAQKNTIAKHNPIHQAAMLDTEQGSDYVPYLKITDRASVITLGGSTNVYGVMLAQPNQVAYNADLGTVVFGHRMPTNGNQAGFDVSTDKGATWTTNLLVTPNNGSYGTRYPNITLYNNDGTGYVAMTGPCTVSGAWGGYLYAGSAKIDGTGADDTYYSNNSNEFHPYGLTATPNGTFWALATNYVDGDDANTYTKWYMKKGTWSAATSSIAWENFETIQPALSDEGEGTLAVDWDMCFDHTGQIGYATIMCATEGAPYNQSMPYIKKTTNGGSTWTTLPLYDFSTIALLQDYVYLGDNATIKPYFSDFHSAVDMNGALHIFVELNSGAPAQGYAYTAPETKNFFDFITTDGTSWEAIFIAPVYNEDGTWTADNINLGTRPEITRTFDGRGMIFSWSEDVAAELAAIEEPDVKAVAMKVDGRVISDAKILTEDTDVEALAYFHQSSNVAIETEEGIELPFVVTAIGTGAADPVSYYYVKGAGWTWAESVIPPISGDDTAPTFTSTPVTTVEPGAVYTYNVTAEDVDGDAITFTGVYPSWLTLNASNILTGTAPTEIGAHDVTLTITANGASVNQAFVINVGNVGINQIALENIKLYPNPVSNYLRISNANGASIEVYNLVGELVMKAANITNVVDVTELASGSYIVKIATENGVATRKINVVR